MDDRLENTHREINHTLIDEVTKYETRKEFNTKTKVKIKLKAMRITSLLRPKSKIM